MIEINTCFLSKLTKKNCMTRVKIMFNKLFYVIVQEDGVA